MIPVYRFFWSCSYNRQLNYWTMCVRCVPADGESEHFSAIEFRAIYKESGISCPWNTLEALQDTIAREIYGIETHG